MLIDGLNYLDYELSSLRSKISLVLQNNIPTKGGRWAAFDANGGIFEPLFGKDDAIISEQSKSAYKNKFKRPIKL